MKNLKILLPVALLLSACWFACRDQDYNDFVREADVAFAGRIVDEDGQAVEGAQVRIGNELAATDANGVFRTKPVRVPANDAKLFVSKIGYFDFSRAYFVQDDALQTVTIQLLRKELTGTFSASGGGVVNVPGGASLNFPAGAVNGSGQVRVFAKYLNPTSPDLGFQMPGDLRAINAAGEEGTLATFGMLGVEIEDQSGQPLQIASGSEVEITMPIPTSQLSVAPASIPLWYYDLGKARWVEEGTAQKVGNQYVGKVKHFSWWNCDIPLPLVQVSGTVLVEPGPVPLADAHVVFSYSTYGGKCHGWTNANGFFSGGIPKDVPLLLEVYASDCNSTPVYSATVGPFSADVTLPDIVISNLASQMVNVEGKLLNCSNQPVADGYLIAEVGTKEFVSFTDANGDFALNFINCGNALSGSATGYDLTNLLESLPQIFNTAPSPVNLGNIAVCNTLSEYIQYTLSGQSYTIVNPTSLVEAGNVYINGFNNQPASAGIYFGFTNNGQTGTFPLNYMAVLPSGDSISMLNVNTVLTDYGNVGEPLIGTFGGTFKNTNNVSQTISGSYRVIREQ